MRPTHGKFVGGPHDGVVMAVPGAAYHVLAVMDDSELVSSCEDLAKKMSVHPDDREPLKCRRVMYKRRRSIEGGMFVYDYDEEKR